MSVNLLCAGGGLGLCVGGVICRAPWGVVVVNALAAAFNFACFVFLNGGLKI